MESEGAACGNDVVHHENKSLEAHTSVKRFYMCVGCMHESYVNGRETLREAHFFNRFILQKKKL